MPTIEVQVRRFSLVSSSPFEEIISKLTTTIGHPDMSAFHVGVSAANTLAELENLVKRAIGSSELMEFVRLISAKSCARNAAVKEPRCSASSSAIRSS